MVSAFRAFVEEHRLWQPKDRILVAVSGGIDSVTLVHLMHLAGYSFALAHVNFALRGSASDADARLVLSLAERYGVPAFQTLAPAREAARAGESIQMTARRLRYAWLEKTRAAEGFDWVATAHQVDDSIETFLINFVRGTGLSGLLGIPLRTQRVVRPLLFATRAEVEAFARQEQLSWREDASNRETDYDRNKIRLQVLPVLRQLNPSLSLTARRTLANLKESAHLADEAMAYWKARCVREEDRRLVIDLSFVRDHPARNSLLYHWLQPFGFSTAQVEQLVQSLDHVGARFEAGGHLLLIDRNQLILEPRPDARPGSTYLLPAPGDQVRLSDGRCLQASEYRPVPRPIPERSDQAWLDAGALEFPLRVRHWRAGDIFQPLGMQGKHQKLQDFFTHLKLDRFQKDRVWLVETSSGAICWIAGYRVDHRFRIRPETRECVVLTMQ